MIYIQSAQIASKSLLLVLVLWVSTLCAASLQAPGPLDKPPTDALFARYEKPYFHRIVASPWIRHLIRGDLSPEAFQHFLGQDVLYLKDYQRASHGIALRFPVDDPRRAFFERHAEQAEEERQWELQQLKAAGGVVLQRSIESNGAYGHFLLDKAKHGTLPEAVAALIPCDTLWEALARYIGEQVTDVAHHPYKDWLRVSGDPRSYELTQGLLDVEAGLLAQTPLLTAAAIDAYKTAAQYEVAFFQDVLREKENSHILKKPL